MNRTNDSQRLKNATTGSPANQLNFEGYDEALMHELCERFATFDRYNIVFNVVIVGPLCLVGFVGNALSLAVLRKDASIKSTVSILMQALAVADSFYLLTCLGFQTLSALCYSSELVPGLMLVYPWMEVYIWPLASVAQTTTVWLVVVITVERYFAICRPFSSICNRTPGEMKFVTGVVFVAAAVYNIPRFFERQAPEKYYNPCRDDFEWVSDHSALRNSHVYRFVYKTCSYFLFRLFLPLTMIVALNGLLVLKMRGQRRLHASLLMVTTKRLNNESVTILLLSMVAAFLLCQLPDFFVRLTAMVSDMASLSVEVTYPTLVCNLLLTVNSSVNCFVYCMSGPRFRSILRRLICGGGASSRLNRSFTTFNSGSSRSLKRSCSNPRGGGCSGGGGGTQAFGR